MRFSLLPPKSQLNRLDMSRMPDQLAEIALKRRFKALSLDEINYCEKCQLLKPTRTHHCRVYNSCIPRMDHHCPILQSCVHHRNHKFYLLCLFWPGVLAVYAVFLCSPAVYKATLRYWIEGIDFSFEEQFIVSAEINAMTIIASVTYLLRNQIQNLLQNRTIIEDSKIWSAEKNEEIHDYSLGAWQENSFSLMGPRWSWFLPMSPPDVAAWPNG